MRWHPSIGKKPEKKVGARKKSQKDVGGCSNFGWRENEKKMRIGRRTVTVINEYTYGHLTPLMVSGRRDTFGRPILVILT